MVDQQLRVDAKRAPVAGSEQHLGAYNDPLTPLVLLERTARVFPRKEAVVYGRERMDWRAFAGLVGRFAAALRRDGIEPGDRVAVLLPNVPVHLASTFAVPLAGAALVAINTRLAAGEVAYILKHSGAKLVLVDPELAGQVDRGRRSTSGSRGPSRSRSRTPPPTSDSCSRSTTRRGRRAARRA